MNTVERAYYHAIGVKKEFPGLNPVSAALMRAGSRRHVIKHHCVIEGYPLPAEGAAILTGNHFSSKDPLVAGDAGLQMAGRVIRTIVKKSLVVRGAYESQKFLEDIGEKSETADYNPIEAFTMRGIGSIPILRNSPESNIAAFRQAYQVLDSGQLLGIFLQASRDEEGFLRNLQKGAAYIASRPKYRNIPIHAFAFSKDRATLVKPFTYNQELARIREDEPLRDGVTVPEFTIIIADHIVSALPIAAQEDWKQRRQTELASLQKN